MKSSAQMAKLVDALGSGLSGGKHRGGSNPLLGTIGVPKLKSINSKTILRGQLFLTDKQA